MNFDELQALIPYAKGGKQKILTMSPYPNITLAMPGRHAEDTIPKGGDFVVMITDPIYPNPLHQFTHDDIFKDVEIRGNGKASLMKPYFDIIQGEDPEEWIYHRYGIGIEPETFVHAVQCLAVAEHRRYHRYESKFGGRYLPFRAAAGIAEGLWTADLASERTRRGGRPGIEWLEQEFGTPALTKELMNES